MADSYKLELNTDDVFFANSHAELLNRVFKTNYKRWGKCVWRHTKDSFAWLVRIDGNIRKGFVNYWINQDILSQRYVETKNMHNGKPLSLDEPNDRRLVFEIIDELPKRYVFRGVFLMNRPNSTPEHMYFQRISDDYIVE